MIGSTRGRRVRRWAKAAALGAFVLFVSSACTLPSFGYPHPITPQGQRAYNIWSGSTIAALAVGAMVWSAILFASFAYRKKSDELPRQVRYNLPVEVLYTVVPFVIVAGLFYYTARDESYINKEPASANRLVVKVVGFRWSWQFSYVNDKGNEEGQVTGKPGEPPVLVLPTDRPVLFELSSPDVIHSFWVPEFLFKRDVIPGHPNSFQVSEITRQGTYIGRCAELCGTDHSRMTFYVRVVSSATFDQYIKSGYNPSVLGPATPAQPGSTS